MRQSVIYVGLDVLKDTITVAVAEDSKRAEVREHGEKATAPAALRDAGDHGGGIVSTLHSSEGLGQIPASSNPKWYRLLTQSNETAVDFFPP